MPRQVSAPLEVRDASLPPAKSRAGAHGPRLTVPLASLLRSVSHHREFARLHEFIRISSASLPPGMSRTREICTAYGRHARWLPACLYLSRDEILLVIRDCTRRMLITCGADENASSSLAERCRGAGARAESSGADC